MIGNDGKQNKIRLVDMRQTWFRCADGQVANLEEATPAQFDAFITEYLEIEDVDRDEWPLLVRWRAVNFAVKNGQFLTFVDAPVVEAETTA